MVRSIHAHGHIKGLCGFFGSMRNTFEVLDGDTLTVTSGRFCGLRFDFEPGLCSVSYGYCSICFDLTGDFTADALIRALLNHRIIKDEDWED